MTRTTGRRSLLVAAILLTLGLTGCTGGTPTPSDPPEPSPSPTASAADAPDPSPSAAPTTGATCDDVLMPEAYAQLEADGLEPIEPEAFDPIAVKMADDGGLVCSWGKPQSDIILRVAQANVDGDEAAWTDALSAAGYTQTDDPVPGAWSGPIEPGSGLSPVVVVAEGTVTFVSAPTFAQWIRPAS
jgi:hypothetical protein